MGRTRIVSSESKAYLKSLQERKYDSERKKRDLIRYIENLKQKYNSDQITYARYVEIIHQKRNGRTIEEWIHYFHLESLNCQRQIDEINRSLRNRRIVIVLLMSFLLIAFVSFTSNSQNIVGFFTQDSSPSQDFSVMNFHDNLSEQFIESSVYTWNLENTGRLNSVKLSGSVVGDGDVRVYLGDLIILDSSKIKVNRARSITAFAVANDSDSDIIEEEVPQEDSSPSQEEPSLSEDSNSENTEEVPQEELLLSENSSSENTEEISPEDSSPSPENSSLSEIINDSNSDIIEEEVPQEDSSPSQEEPSLSETVRFFDEYCDETCFISDLNLTNDSYELRIEVDGVKLNLDIVDYQLIFDGEVPEEVVEVNETQIVQINLISNATVKTVQHQAIIGQPVRWTKEIKLKENGAVKVKVPKDAENITAYKINKRDISGTRSSVSFSEEDVQREIVSLTGMAISNPSDDSVIVRFFGRVFGAITGNVVSNDIEITIEDNSSDYELEYYTEAPTAVEENITGGKRITINGPDELHYQNILAFSTLEKEVSELKLYHIVNGSRVEVQFNSFDNNGNGLIDYIEWGVPHLSEQVYEIIEITQAEHLDSDRVFISEIYDEVKEQDDIWSEEIVDGHYVRVTFERNLTSEKDITIYPRTVSGSPRVEIYEKDGNDIIAEFESINDNELNKVYLEGLEGSQDSFDLLILDGSVEFDLIIDPTVVLETGTVSTNGWTTVNLTNTFTSPVVVASSLDGFETSADLEVATAVVTNITSTSFDVQLYNDTNGAIAGEVGYIVVDSGSHYYDGMLIQAGTIEIDYYGANGDDAANIYTANFPIAYASNPVVVATANKDSAQDWVSVRYETGTLSTSSIGLKMELPQSYGNSPIAVSGIGDGQNNTIGWIAINATSISDMEAALEASVDEDPNAGDWRDITFTNTYTDPVFFAMGEEAGGTDPTHIGIQNLNGTFVQIRQTEERTDGEQTHATEDVLWVVFEGSFGSFYPQFSNYQDNNATLIDSGTGYFNVTVENTNGTVLLEINGTNVTATNLSSNVYNASYTFITNGTYTYRWHSWGNETDELYNFSVDRDYYVNASLVVSSCGDGVTDGYYVRTVLDESFESPAAPTTYADGTVPYGWAKAVQGFAATRVGSWNISQDGNISTPYGDQVLRVDYSANAGVTTNETKIYYKIRANDTYNISFYVSNYPDGGSTTFDNYDVDIIGVNKGDARDDTRIDATISMYDLSSSGGVNTMNFTQFISGSYTVPSGSSFIGKYIGVQLSAPQSLYDKVVMTINTTEECDDGGTTNGDGCTSFCQLEYPQFSNYIDGCASPLINNGTAKFNVTLDITNETVLLEINGTNVTATHLGSNVYSANYTFTTPGYYPYRWHSFSPNYGSHNSSALRDYSVVNGTLKGQLQILNLSSNCGLNPYTGQIWKQGDTYRYVFVTNQTTNSSYTSMDYYNTFVQNVANTGLSNLSGTTWKAIGSNGTIDARDNTNTNIVTNSTPTANGPFYMLNKELIATSISDLWDGTILTQLDIIQTGALKEDYILSPVPYYQWDPVWTGTSTNGVKSANYLGASTVTHGLSQAELTFAFSRSITTNNWSMLMYGMSAPLTIQSTADTTPPVVNLSYPPAGYVNSTSQYVNLTFNASVSDNVQLKNCSLWTNYSGTWSLNQTQNRTGTTNTTSFNLTGLTNKTFIWNIRCWDTSNNGAFNSTNRTVILNWTAPDTTPPVVNLSYPPAGYVNSTSQYVNLTFNASVSDNVQLKNCSLWTNYSGTWSLNQTQNRTGTTNTTSFNLTGLTNKTFIWNIRCFDTSNNGAFNSTNRTVILNWTAPDITPPVIELISPVNGTNDTDGIVTYQFNVTDLESNVSSCEFIVDGNVRVTNSSIVEGVVSEFRVGLLSGVYDWNINCTSQGGTNSSEIRTINISSDVIFEDTFSSAGGFNNDSVNQASWERGNATQSPINGCFDDAFCWGTNLTGNYNGTGSSTSNLTQVIGMDLSSYSNITFWFNHYRHFEDSGTLWDGGVIELSLDNGASWERLTPNEGYTGNQTNNPDSAIYNQFAYGLYSEDWEVASFNLSNYSGNSSVKIRFVFATDTAASDAGWFVDTVRVTGSLVVDTTNPSVKFNSQNPSDLDTLNLFSQNLNITYNVSDNTALNLSTINLYYKTNNSQNEILYYINGTIGSQGYVSESYLSNVSNVFKWQLNEYKIYPGIYNLNETLMELTPHNNYVLSSSNSYLKIRLFNVSNSKQYSIFELFANATSDSGPLRIYYCNSSYSYSDPLTSLNCVDFYNLEAQAFNHNHSNYSYHHIIPFAVNTTSKLINGQVYVTPTSYFLLRGRDGSQWNISYINQVSRPDTIQNLTLSTETERPNQAGSVTQLARVCTPTCTSNFQAVDEAISDGDTTYVRANTTTIAYDLYNASDLTTSSATIKNVTVFVVARAATQCNGLCQARTQIRTNGVIYNGTTMNLTGTTYTTYSTSYINNPQTGQPWTVSEVNNMQIGVGLKSRANVNRQRARATQVYAIVEYTNHNNFSGTVDAHLHQYDGSDSFWYYACANDTSGNQNCSLAKQDLLNLVGLPPTSPEVYNPITGYYSNNITINYTESISPNEYTISYYNISLVYSNLTFVQSIINNNSKNLSYVWNSTAASDGDYRIEVQACDNQSQCSEGRSQIFTIDNTIPPIIQYVSPTETSGDVLSRDYILINVTAQDDNFDRIRVRLYNSTHNLEQVFVSSSPAFANFSNLTSGLYYFNASAYDLAGNINYTETRNVTIDLVYPTITLITPPNNAVDPDGMVYFNCSANDSSIVNVSLYINGVLNDTIVAGGVLEFTANFSVPIVDGTYNWSCGAWNYGNFNQSGNRTTVVNTTANPTYNTTVFNGNTLNWSNVIDIINVCNGTAILDNTDNGQIQWLNCVNAEGADFDVDVNLSYNNITVVSENLNETFNTTAVIILRNLTWDATPLIYRNGALCPEAICTNATYNVSTGIATFNVTQFTSYTTVGNAQMEIWDENDSGMPYGDQIKYVDEQVKFFSNYTQNIDGSPITGATCFINFTDSNGTMTYNATDSIYEYNRSFATNGTFDWNVTCSALGFQTITLTDNVIINVVLEDPYPTFSNYKDNNATLIGPGTGYFQVDVNNSNGTVYLEIDGNNITSTALSGQLGLLDFTVNNGINPQTGSLWKVGDKYRLIFITSNTTNATSSDISYYNNFVQTVANGSNITTLKDVNWYILGETPTVRGIDNVHINTTAGDPDGAFFLVDGKTQLANNIADVLNGMDNSPNLNENGSTRNAVDVWTGWNGGSTRTLGGSESVTNVGRTSDGSLLYYNRVKTIQYPVFAMSEVLTVQAGSIYVANYTFSTNGTYPYRWYAWGDGASEYYNVSEDRDYVVWEGYPPTWSDNKTNISASTTIGDSVYFNVTLSDVGVGAYYIFSYFDGSVWVNDSATAWTSPEELTEVRTIDAFDGRTIKWYWWFNDTIGNSNKTNTFSFTLVDNIYPEFSNYSDNNATLNDSGVGYFNVTVENTNGTVYLEINGTNVTATAELWEPSETELELWMDASDLSTISEDDAPGRVSDVVDKSGKNNHMNKTTASQQFYTGLYNMSNTSLNTFYADGTDAMGLSLTSSIDMHGKETYAVFEITSLTEDFTIFGGNGNHQSSTVLTSGLMRNWANSNAWTPVDLKPSWILITNTPYLGGWIHDIASKTFMLNGSVQTGLGVQNNLNSLIANSVGYQQYAEAIGKFGEVIVVSKNTNNITRQRIEGYLAHKWNLTSSLPANHPYKTSAPLASSGVYQANYTFTEAGTYDYRWHSWGSGTDEDYNVSEDRDYYVNESAVELVNTSYYGISIPVGDTSFSSSNYTLVDSFQFSTVNTNTSFGFLSSMEFEKTSGSLTTQVYTNITIDGVSVYEGVLRTLGDVNQPGVAGTDPFGALISEIGLHQLDIYYKRIGDGTVVVRNVDFSMGQFETTAGYSGRGNTTSFSNTFNSTTPVVVFNKNISKLVNTSTFVAATIRVNSSLQQDVVCRFKNGGNSSYFGLNVPAGGGIRSMSGNYIGSPDSMVENFSIECYNTDTNAPVDIEGTINEADMADNAGNPISHVSLKNPNTNWTTTTNLTSGNHTLLETNYTVLNGTNFLVSFQVSSASLTGGQTPRYYITVSNSSGEVFHSKKNRYTSGDIGNTFFYPVVEGLAVGEEYTIKAFVTVPTGENLSIYDEQLSIFENTIFSTEILNTPPIVDILYPEESHVISGEININFTVSESQGDDFKSNVTAFNGTDTIDIALNLDNSTFYTLWNVTDLNEGWWNLTVQTCEVGTVLLYCANATNDVLLNNPPTHTAPFINSTFGTNYSSEDLTCYNQSTSDPSGDPVKNIYNWYVGGTSIQTLNVPFEDSSIVEDYSGYDYNGTITDAIWNGTGGHDGKGAYEFDGNGDYLEFDSEAITDGNFTISMWFKPAEAAGGTIFDASLGGIYFFLAHDATNFRWYFESSNDADSQINYANSFSPDTWYHVAAIGRYDSEGHSADLYFNGTWVANATINLNSKPTLNPIRLGTSYGIINTYGDFNGTIDDVQIFNRALSPEQIATIYNNGTNIIKSNETAEAETWTCEVTPNDGYSDGETLAANITLVQTDFVYPIFSNYADNNATLIDAGLAQFNVTVINTTGVVNLVIDGDSYSATNISADYTVSVYLTQDGVHSYYWESYGNGTQQNYNSSPIRYYYVNSSAAPTHTAPILSSSLGFNTTYENLTCYNQTTADDGGYVKNVVNWYKDGTPYLIWNVPMEGESNNTWVRDYSSNSWNGTVNEGIWNDTGGYDGRGAYEFNDIDSDSDLIYYDVDDFNATNLTVAMWVKPRTVSQGAIYNSIFSSSVGSDTDSFQFQAGNTGYGISHTDYSFNFGAITTDWTYVAFTTNGTEHIGYVNGVEAGSTTSAFTYHFFEYMKIGINRGNTYGFNGTIDEVMVFNATLSPEQINAIYNNQTNLIVSQETEIGENWTCEVTPTDGYHDGTTLLSNNITILDDLIYPIFSNYDDNNATLTDSGVGYFNVTVENTNGTVYLEINGTNVTAINVAGDIYNANHTFAVAGVYPYKWHSWGNGPLENYNVSETRDYYVNAAAGNQAPTVIYVSPIANVNPIEAGVANVTFYATINDSDGTSDINSVIANFTRGSEPVRENLSCVNISDITSTSGNYSCTIKMYYFDEAGDWNITVWANDSVSNSGINDSTYFQYNQLSAIVIDPNNLNFTVNSGAFNQSANNNPMTINNTGNANLTDNIAINSTNLLGETVSIDYLPVENFSVSIADNCDGTTLQNATQVNITGVVLERGNLSAGQGQEQMYFCIKEVGTITAQTYSTQGAGSWLIKIILSLILISPKKRKKRKLVIDDLSIPASVFKTKLGALEALSKYLKENLGLTYSEIAELLNRDDRTIWTAYNKSAKKNITIKIKANMAFIPVSIFKNRELTVLEAMVVYLKNKGMKYVEIGELLNRDQRNVWTVYSRSMKKEQKEIDAK